MCMNNSAPTAMPCSKDGTTMATLMLDIHERGHEVGNTPKAEQETDYCCPRTGKVLKIA
jgi:hypothetical protein